MKIVSWNIRGCNSPLKKRLLKRKIDKEKSAIVFLQETKCRSEEMIKTTKRVWKGARVETRDAEGAAGGLSVMWNPNLVSFHFLCASSFSIFRRFQILGTKIKGVVTNVYGPFQTSKKATFLAGLSDLKDWVKEDPWIIGGDFNIIRSLDEKKGGVRTTSAATNLFNKFIEETKLVDIRPTNGMFTWQNKSLGGRHITSRLD